LSQKLNAFDTLQKLCLNLQTQQDTILKRLRNDHENDFANNPFNDFYAENGINRRFQHQKYLNKME
jgi:hypothetical protein